MSDEEFGAELGRYIRNVQSGIVASLLSHYRILERWNRRLNLTSLPAGEDWVRRHFAESLFLADFLPSGASSIVDVGSGAGFPGLPIAALRPDLSFTLIEADQRKAVFLQEASARLGNVSVVCERAEQVDSAWDAAVSRAVHVPGVRAFALKHARWLGLLTSGEIAGKFEWSNVAPLPWSANDVVAELYVSRGTT